MNSEFDAFTGFKRLKKTIFSRLKNHNPKYGYILAYVSGSTR